MFSLMLIGCGGGGGGSSKPNIAADRTTYDFGDVTVGKTATLQVTLRNTGKANLNVTALATSDADFSVASSGTCGAVPFTIVPGEDCTLGLTFAPSAVGLYTEQLTVTSNDPDTPNYRVTLNGAGTEVTELTVSLNQIDATDCPTIKAYVTVTDQNGFFYDELGVADFSITENPAGVVTLISSEPVDPTDLTLATAIVMDYSWSVAGDPDNKDLFEAMKEGAKTFVSQMRSIDLASIIKFATTNEVTQDFTTVKDDLIAAIGDVPNIGTETLLYDTLYLAISNAAVEPVDRRAVIVLTDGRDYDADTADQLSSYTKEQVIAHAQANAVPIFTIRAGDDARPEDLQQMADETGGQYFDAPTADRLITIYQQMAEILNSQYLLTYTSASAELFGTVTAEVTVNDVDQPGVMGDTSDPLEYVGCSGAI